MGTREMEKITSRKEGQDGQRQESERTKHQRGGKKQRRWGKEKKKKD